MATETTQALIEKAKAIKPATFYLALGSGLTSWDTDGYPPEDPAAVGLVNELIRREADVVEYVTPDPAGTIVAPVWNGTIAEKKFSISATPTQYLYFSFQFATTDVPTATLREIGLFLGSSEMIALEYLQPKIVRSAVTRQLFEFVYSV